MNRKSIWIAGIVAVFAVSLIATSNVFIDASGDPEANAPRYSETCAHGHNGFDCKPPKHVVDISELQERTANLEKRVTQLERSR